MKLFNHTVARYYFGLYNNDFIMTFKLATGMTFLALRNFVMN